MAKATKKRRKSQKLSKNPAQESPKADPAATEQVFETFVQSNEAILAGMAALNSEMATFCNCLLYTSDAADEEESGDVGGRTVIK